MTRKNILVLGAGVSGLTTAVELLRRGHQVTVWSREYPGEYPSTSHSAYAMWVPVRIDSDRRIERWTNETFQVFARLAANPTSGFAHSKYRPGVAMRKIVSLKMSKETPWFASSLGIFRHAAANEVPTGYADAHILDGAPVIDPSSYLPWLRLQVTVLGGNFIRRTVKNFDECTGFDFVVNATGLGARELTGDTGLFPERVQVVTIKHNGFDHVLIDDEGPNQRTCIVPHEQYVKLGAVFDGAKETLETDDVATRSILSRCNQLAPGFKFEYRDILSVKRALRPERSAPRCELETLPNGIRVVHNYGHDGMGYLLSYGMADEVASIIAAASAA